MSLLIRNFRTAALIPKRGYSEVVNVFGRRNVDTSGNVEKAKQAVVRIPESDVRDLSLLFSFDFVNNHNRIIKNLKERVQELSGIPKDFAEERRVRVFIAAKNSMQSGTFSLRRWKLEFDNRERWENNLMGWGSSGDPTSSLQIEFPTREDAIVYCERMG
jgi:NADH dehydrogenase (ubiquinone) Fe-S protein 4